jgi:hypothetical protein
MKAHQKPNSKCPLLHNGFLNPNRFGSDRGPAPEGRVLGGGPENRRVEGGAKKKPLRKRAAQKVQPRAGLLRPTKRGPAAPRVLS